MPVHSCIACPEGERGCCLCAGHDHGYGRFGDPTIQLQSTGENTYLDPPQASDGAVVWDIETNSLIMRQGATWVQVLSSNTIPPIDNIILPTVESDEAKAEEPAINIWDHLTEEEPPTFWEHLKED